MGSAAQVLDINRRDALRAESNERMPEAVTRVAALDKAGHGRLQSSSAPAFAYCDQVTRGDYCLLDCSQAAIPEPGKSVTADLSEILYPEDQFCLTEEFLIKPASE